MNKPMSTRDIAEAADRSSASTEAAIRDDDAGRNVTRHAVDGSADNAPLFHDEEGRGFRSRWEAVQTGFVDEPRAAVEQADALVAEVIKRLAEVFATERTTLEQQWGRGDNVSTEDLRVAMKRYRSFFERLLSV
jgi:hypothetical protein